ncbi:MAG: FimB/Mfa2 family fimbrial subunit [Dysgonomonas sp.]
MDEDCGYFVSFVYDYNIVREDLFSDQVTKINLYVFDENGVFIEAIKDEGGFPRNYRIPFSMDKGRCHFITWAGLYDDSYQETELIPGKSKYSDLIVNVISEDGVVDKKLKPLWYGARKDVDFNSNGLQIENISLVKDTKIFRIVMQNVGDGDTIDINDFDITISAANGRYDFYNAPFGESITYKPYFTMNDPETGAVAEMNTLRLMSNVDNRLVIRNKKTGEDFLNIQLNKYLNALKLEKYAEMSLQEYLDREDNFSIIFFFKGYDGNGYTSFDIQINEWFSREQIVEE